MDVELILTTLQDHKLIRMNKPTGDWYSIFCPFHSDGQEKKPSCGVCLHTHVRGGTVYKEGMYHCFACGSSYDMEQGVSEILKSHKIPLSGRDWLIQNVPGYVIEDDFHALIPEDTIDAVISKHTVKYMQEKTQTIQTYVSEEELATYRYTVPYMYERKLTDEIIEKYDIGYDAKWIPSGRKKPVPCITIPVRNRDGKTLFLCRRSIKGKIYNYPQGVSKPVFGIYELPYGTKSVVVCESAINALTSVIYGYPAVALLGTGNAYQIQQLKEMGIREFTICMDGDDAGRKATEKLQKYLKSVAIVWTMHMPDGKDVNDCTKVEFDNLYAKRD